MHLMANPQNAYKIPFANAMNNMIGGLFVGVSGRAIHLNSSVRPSDWAILFDIVCGERENHIHQTIL